MRDVTDRRQSLAAEAIRPDFCQIFKGFELRRRESLAEDGEVFTLIEVNLSPCK